MSSIAVAKRWIGVPPGPRTVPPLAMLKRWWDPLGFVRGGASYGDVVCFVPNHFYLVNHPDHVRRILLEKQEFYRKDPRAPSLTAEDQNSSNAESHSAPRCPAADELEKPDYKFIGGRSVALSEGAAWRRQRTMVQPIFSRRAIASLSSVVSEATRIMLREWQAKGSAGTPIDVERDCEGLILKILVRSLFGEGLGPEAETITRAIADNHHYFEARSRALLPTPRGMPTLANLRFRRSFEVLSASFFKLIDEGNGRHEHHGGNLLDHLLQARDRGTGEGLTRRQIHDELLMLTLLGHKTTATALTWTLYLISQAPEVEERLSKEFVSVAGERDATIEDLPRLTYTRQVLDESMRLYPPAWVIGRVAAKDDEIGGYRLPAGATVILSPYLLHRHPDFWPRPDTFDPERFSSECTGKRPRFLYLPFGEGDRVCIASSFAMMQLSLILAAITRGCTLKPIPGSNVRPEIRVVLRPRGGLPMTVHPKPVAVIEPGVS